MKFFSKANIQKKLICYYVIINFLIAYFGRGFQSNDFNETVFLSKNLLLAYEKHPGLAFWVSWLFFHLPTFLINPLALVFCFLILFSCIYIFIQFVNKFLLTSDKSLIVYIAICVINIMPTSYITELNPDLFAFIFYISFSVSAYYVLVEDKLKYWVLLTLSAFFGFLSKYHLLISFLSIIFFFINDKKGRDLLISKRAIISVFTFSSLSLVYLFSVFKYANGNSLNYIDRIGVFIMSRNLISILVRFLPIPLVLVGFLIACRDIGFVKQIKSFQLFKMSRNVNFLVSNTVFPILVYLLIGLLTERKVSSRYLACHGVFFSLSVVYFFKEQIEQINLDNFKFKMFFLVALVFIPMSTFLFEFYFDTKSVASCYAKAYQDIKLTCKSNKDIDMIVKDDRHLDSWYLFFPEKPDVLSSSNISNINNLLDTVNVLFIWRDGNMVDVLKSNPSVFNSLQKKSFHCKTPGDSFLSYFKKVRDFQLKYACK